MTAIVAHFYVHVMVFVFCGRNTGQEDGCEQSHDRWVVSR